MLKAILNILLLFSGKKNLGVLTYHRVGNINNIKNQLFTDEVLFNKQLSWLAEYFNVLDLGKAITLLENKELPKLAVVISIDDGYVDSYETIFQLLKSHGLLASFFISTSGFEKGYLWDELVSEAVMQISVDKEFIVFLQQSYALTTYNEKLSSLKKILEVIKYHSLEERQLLINELLAVTGGPKLEPQFLNAQQIIIMKNAGMTIGAHTVNHPILMAETTSVAEKEIAACKEKLESIINAPVDFLAYPNGKLCKDFTLEHQQMAEAAGYKAAFSTEMGSIDKMEADRFSLKRLSTWDHTEIKFVLRLAYSLIGKAR